jgi:uncharacterized heparinase superfamily protein
MPHYFFDLVNGSGLTRDDEGQELPDLEAARLEAIRQARPIIAEEVLNGRIDLTGRIVVRSDGPDSVLELPFGEAVHVTGA